MFGSIDRRRGAASRRLPSFTAVPRSIALPALLSLAVGLQPSRPVRAADVEGWMRQQAERNSAVDPCIETIARANAARGPDASHRAGLCYLRGSRADLFAARAWLSDAAGQDHAPARALLDRIASLEREPDAAAAPHCHDLGEGRRLCHGGAAPER